MDHLQQFIKRGKLYAYILIVLINFVLIASWWVISQILHLPSPVVLSILFILAIALPLIVVPLVSTIFVQPLTFVWQAILYMAPETTSVPAPELHKVRYARELVTNLVNHVYQLADASKHVAKTVNKEAEGLHNNFIANSLPLPLMVLDKHETILFANTAMLHYLGQSEEDVVNQSVYSHLDLSFETDDTLDTWLKHAKSKHVATSKTWERVRLTIRGDKPTIKLLDLVAYYNKSNPAGYETMLVCFDRTKTYAQDEQAINFVALAVHELRTPLTMLRGYIEALDEELKGKLNDELSGFLQKTQVAAGQLATFVNNILNVARIEDDHMVLKLQKENWQEVLNTAINELRPRAQVRGIDLKLNIADDLPEVGADRVSLYEVISNLIDNAIKYSGQGKEIIVSAKLSKDGLVETTIEDHGVGIPASAIPRVFDKFYRDHHNRSQIGGSGLGLYLCKTIIKAHGGNIWVHSKEGEGSTFGFTLLPYSELADELKNEDNEGIVRNAHGWIKNHSLYRG